MKVTINRDDCISCGVCMSVCPEVFRFADDGLAEAYGENPENFEDSVTVARDSCPVSIIDIEQ